MTMITPSYLGETIEYSSLHACRSTLEDPTDLNFIPGKLVLPGLDIREGETESGFGVIVCIAWFKCHVPIVRVLVVVELVFP